MITAPQFNLINMRDSNTVRPSAENQVYSSEQSFIDLICNEVQRVQENREVNELTRQDDGRSQENTPDSREMPANERDTLVSYESGERTENQMAHTRGDSCTEKNIDETESRHHLHDEGIFSKKGIEENEEAFRINTREQGAHKFGKNKKIENSRNSDESHGTREHKNERMADVQVHAQAALEALRTVQEPSVQLKELRRVLNAFQAQFDGADSARRMQLARELRSRARDIIGQIEVRDETGRNNGNAHLANVKGKLKTLAESLERGHQNGGERRENAGNAPAGLSENTERHSSIEPSSVSEMRFEIGKQTDILTRAESAACASTRGSMPQINAQAPQRLAFMNDQFEMLMHQARITVRDARNSTFTMNMYPETLGRVNVNLGLEDGVLVGRFLVDTPEARDAMMESMDRLLAQLADAGIEVGAFQVNVRGERDRLVQNLQGYLAENRRRAENKGSSEYDAHTVRTHDGLLDVIA